MDFTTMASIADDLGIDPTGRAGAWRERIAQDQPSIDLVRSSRIQDPLGTTRPRTAAQGVLPLPRPQPQDPQPQPSWTLAPSQTVTDKLEQALEHIARQSELNAFVSVFSERARREARQLDERDARGMPRGPLHGAIVAVKDNIAVRGHRTTAGTRALAAEVSRHDAEVVRRLTAAGAVLIGTTNLHALAFGPFSTSSDAGAVVNPLRPEAVAGGSSGGSAAALASGAVDLALGTDTAGSIRIPGSACGVVGLKGTYGCVPTDGVHPLAPSLDHVGPMARTVAETALAWMVISDGVPTQQTEPTDSLEGLVVGDLGAYAREFLDDTVREALDSALATATGLGARVQVIDVPDLNLAPALTMCTIGPEALDIHRELLHSQPDDLPPDVRLRLESAILISAADYARAQRLRRRLSAQLSDTMAETDVLLLPTVPIIAPTLDALDGTVAGRLPTRSAMSRLTAPFNLTGQPALTLPWHHDRHGGGIGVQIVGALHDEGAVLQVAAALEDARPTTTNE